MTTISSRPSATSGRTCSIPAQPTHPLGSRARVLLCSVFAPYAQDDQFGSRAMNPMELWHNQVTREQGAFSLRMFHRSWGLMLIQANLSAPTTCLDFPTRERFIAELRECDYDVIGISAIIPNLKKVAEMCRLIRQYRPGATIVVGGHISTLGDLERRLGADHVVRGDGVRWFRAYLGEDTDAAINHPVINSGINARCMGVRLPHKPRSQSAALIPSVGCPVGCNFCATSAMFGGKGKVVNFFDSADDLFAVMCGLERTMKVQSFFVMDENFLLNHKRAMQLLELMRKHDKAWGLYCFSSASAIKQYSMEELAALGVSWLWMGLEGKDSRYGKLRGTDTHQLVRELQDHGIRVLGSSIIGLEEHTPDNIDEAISHAVAHASDFHQFMLYTPIPGTPLYAELDAAGRLVGEQGLALEDTHGQYRFNYKHPSIPAGDETEMLRRAFEQDFITNGPSATRVFATALKGYRRYKNHPDARIRLRFAWEVEGMWLTATGAVWAARKWFAGNEKVARDLDKLLGELIAEFGLKARLVAPLAGRVMYRALRREAAYLAGGGTYEPPTYYQRNFHAACAARRADTLQSIDVTGQSAVGKLVR